MHFWQGKQGSHRLEKYLKMKGSLEKSLKTKPVLKSPWKLSIDLEKYLKFTFSCILDNFKSLRIKSKVPRKKSASFEQRQRCRSAIIKEVECAGHENKVRIHRGSNNSYLMFGLSPLQTDTWRFWQLLLLKKVNSNNQTKQKTKMVSAAL